MPQRRRPAVPGGRPAHRWRAPLAAAALLLLVVLVLSLGIGAKALSPGQVWHGLFDPAAPDYTVVHRLRLPRTLLGLLVGAALGLAGGLMQALTRNPLADPGLLGINAGASAAVVTATALLGIGSFDGYVWFALAGAAAVAVLVYAVGGGRTATPARLALAGAALNATLYSYVSALMLLNAASLERMRVWTVGSLADARPGTVLKVLPFVLAGLLVALALARPLNALALGEETARAQGARPARVRALTVVAITLLCGAATAACGPIVFVGLMVPHLARAAVGPDLRRLLPCCALLAPALLLGSDVLGRLLGRPGEVQVGVVTAVVGGPFFLLHARRGKTVRG
ncbi:iron chelate uptake ABC transporter family permease subunit [Kitasatospora sp. NPDC006697]|uniref:iron chelate uptake ABC transporter family permease subunit n=1 Tax=Kitasatospora sp. NPDC006697 TaxID=3364020 RepID=UPI003676ED40